MSNCFILGFNVFRWIPPSLPIAKSPDLEKESGATYAAGRSRVIFFSVLLRNGFSIHIFSWFNLVVPVKFQRVEQERTLTDSQRDEFEDLLRALTLERRQIKEAMGFALDNADAAGEVMVFSSIQYRVPKRSSCLVHYIYDSVWSEFR